jgi:hypothetical protein
MLHLQIISSVYDWPFFMMGIVQTSCQSIVRASVSPQPLLLRTIGGVPKARGVRWSGTQYLNLPMAQYLARDMKNPEG